MDTTNGKGTAPVSVMLEVRLAEIETQTSQVRPNKKRREGEREMIITTNCNTPNSLDLLIIDVDVMRDLFAAFALSGMIQGSLKDRHPAAELAASHAYQYAAAMLKARNEERER